MYTSCRGMNTVDVRDVGVDDNVTLHFLANKLNEVTPRLIIRYETGAKPTLRILIDQLGGLPVSVEYPK